MKRPRTDTRKTIAYFPSHRVAEDFGMYVHMFLEDARIGLSSYRWARRDRGAQWAEIRGDTESKAAVVAICSSLADYPEREASDAVLAAIEAIGSRLGWLGNSVYEVCRSDDGVALATIPPDGLFRVPGGFVQMVPSGDRWFSQGRRFAFLKGQEAWSISIPSELGGPRGHRRLLSHLRAVGKPAPDFWARELEAGRPSKDFSLTDYHRNRDAYVARITRRWGWNRRDSTLNYDDEFFYFFRSLRFRWALAVLRNHIVNEMNEFLLKQNVKAKIQLTGFCSPDGVVELMRKSGQGLVHYAQALKDAE